MMDDEVRVAELEYTLKQRDARIRELTEERDANRTLVAEMNEQIENMNAAFDRWIEAFDMEINVRGEYHWCQPLMQRYDELVAEHRRVLRGWNMLAPQHNAAFAPRWRNFARPLAAHLTQRDYALKRRKAWHSLRAKANETSPSSRTVRAINAGGVDRATLARLERIFPDRLAAAQERASKRLRDGPARNITEL